MSISIHKELRHRGEPLVAYPGAELWKAVGGSDGVAALIKDLYRRIEQDEVLRVAFPHFNSGEATPFFMQWFGGSRGYADDLAGGLLRRHQHRYISAKAAAAWLRCMRAALVARGLDAEQIMRPLARIAKAMIHSPETEPNELCKSCDAVQDAAQVHFETLLNDAAKGRTENVRKALAKDPALASRRGLDNRTLAWVATYSNRPRILGLTLQAGADCNTPACDSLYATMACDHVQMGTGVAVTPLAIARKWQPALVAPLVEHGAIDDVFTAAWLGDLPALRVHIERNPELVNAIDPADDFKEVSLLCHAVCGGSTGAVKLLLEQGALVKRHSGKLLTLAVVMNRVDLVRLLIEHGADVERTGFLGRLDDSERPVADLLIAHGKKVPDWMLPRACRPDVSTNELHRVTVLLDYGASVDDRGRYGLTALHYAVRGGKLPLIKLLLERGARHRALPCCNSRGRGLFGDSLLARVAAECPVSHSPWNSDDGRLGLSAVCQGTGTQPGEFEDHDRDEPDLRIDEGTQMQARLEKRSWLCRTLRVTTVEGDFVVHYRGCDIGQESVLVDGHVIAVSRSILWFVPTFEFSLGSRKATIGVRVWPWLAIRRFELIVEGSVLYREGS